MSEKDILIKNLKKVEEENLEEENPGEENPKEENLEEEGKLEEKDREVVINGHKQEVTNLYHIDILCQQKFLCRGH